MSDGDVKLVAVMAASDAVRRARLEFDQAFTDAIEAGESLRMVRAAADWPTALRGEETATQDD
jgi:prophage DNA circulation protein